MGLAVIEKRRVRLLLMVALILAWAVSLFLPVADAGPGRESVDGATALMIGWMGVLMFQFAWFANVVLFAVLFWCARSRVRPGLLYSSGGLLLLLTLDAAFWRDIPDDAGHNYIQHYSSGYWLWMATMAVAGLWALLRPRLASAAPA